MDAGLRALLAWPPGADLNAAFDTLDRYGREQPPSGLVDLVAALADAETPAWARGALLGHSLRILCAHRAPAALDALGAILALDSPLRPGRWRAEVAARLADAHPVNALLQAEAAGLDADLLARWLQECVLRGQRLGRLRALVALRERLAAQDRVLAELPLGLLTEEDRLASRLPRLSARGRSLPAPKGPEAPSTLPAPPDGLHPEELDEPLGDAAAAVARWHSASNGRVDVSVHEIYGADPLRALPALRLPCASGGPPLAGQRVTVDVVLAELFSAASSGGAYGRGVEGAEGRLLAWRSAAALADAPGGLPQEAAPAIRACQWVQLDPDTPWFDQVGWDLWLACARPDGTLAVLAATDSD
ncbi:MAG: hypothetical protein H6739_23355 [Alphaproteobacteria bacterium]|nr:hypothetical protein [Alphaproteobacteria bacterium]